MSFFGQQNNNQQQGTGFGGFGANSNTTPTGKQITANLSSNFHSTFFFAIGVLKFSVILIQIRAHV